MEVVYWIIGLLAFILVLAVTIGLHEAGHMGVAKIFKLSVPRFFVGFGPTIWSKKSSKTEYGIKAIPLGGFVTIEDDTQPEDSIERSLLSYVSPFKRTMVFLAGPLVNIALGTVILIGVLLYTPMAYVSSGIEAVNTCDETVVCGASTSGIKPGDEILSIDGNALSGEAENISTLTKDKESVDIVVQRGSQELSFENVPVENDLIGVALSISERDLSVAEAFDTLEDVIYRNVEALTLLPEKVPGLINKISDADSNEEVPASVVAVGKTYGDITADSLIPGDDKVRMLAIYSGMLNIGIGMINLLPIMPLDGGRILIAGIDAVRKAFSKITRGKWAYKPFSAENVNNMTIITASVVFGFMSLVIISDIVQIVRGQI